MDHERFDCLTPMMPARIGSNGLDFAQFLQVLTPRAPAKLTIPPCSFPVLRKVPLEWIEMENPPVPFPSFQECEA